MKRFSTLLLMVVLAATACASKKPVADEAPDDASMHTPPSGSEKDAKMPDSPPVVRPGDSDGASGEPTAEATGGEDVPEGAETVTRAEVDQFLDKGPPYVLTVVKVEPVHRGGFQGYQIVEVTRGVREFMMPQLRVGDVVTHVNGVKLERPEDLMQAWRSLDKVSSIRVDFKRKNEPMHAVWVVE